MTASHKKVNAGTSKRVKTLSVTRPIIYGNTAKKLGETRPPNAPAEHTHIWTIFVRGPQNEDISYFIKKVVFKLHDTYPNATRTVDAPPFELTETGWGEFEINDEISAIFYDEVVFNEPNEQFFHILMSRPGNLLPSNKTESCVFSRQLEQEEIDRINIGIHHVDAEIEELKAKISKELKD